LLSLDNIQDGGKMKMKNFKFWQQKERYKNFNVFENVAKPLTQKNGKGILRIFQNGGDVSNGIICVFYVLLYISSFSEPMGPHFVKLF
jgi:hypothetical protein